MPPQRRRPREGESEVPAAEPVQLSSRWETPTDVPILFANQFFVRFQQDEVIITFGQAELPYEAQLSEETRKRLAQEGIPVQVVARLGMTTSKLGELIQYLTTVQEMLSQRPRQEARP